MPRSRWSNPFLLGPHGNNRAKVVQKYSDWLDKQALKEEVVSLKGKVLLCHCKDDEECHADFLIG